MGLDMYAYAIDSTEDFDDVIIESKPQKAFYSQAQLLHEWRKHPNLHGWIEQNIYRNADNQDQDFNCVLVKIDRENLIALENAIKNNALPFTTGFFSANHQAMMTKKKMIWNLSKKPRLLCLRAWLFIMIPGGSQLIKTYYA